MTSPWYRAALPVSSWFDAVLSTRDSLSHESIDFASDWTRAIANLGRSLAWAGFGAACEQRGLTCAAEYFEKMQRDAEMIGNGHIRWPSHAAFHVRIALLREEP